MHTRHRWLATIFSLLYPGLGQWYNRQWLKGALLTGLGACAWIYFGNHLFAAWRGLWTLGETPSRFITIDDKLTHVPGDHSIQLLVKGLIVTILFAAYLAAHIANVKDAYRTGARRDSGRPVGSFAGTLRHVHDTKFAQVLLTIPFAGILFLTVLPIIFMILLAFTNYSSPNHLPPAQLVDWTGLDTFIQLFRMKNWSSTFVDVLVWTIIWTIAATATTFGGGMLVALVLHQKEIRLKGMWRTMIIIPYAVPQIISLLAMKMIFNGQFGPINQYLGYFGLDKLPWLTDPLLAKATVVLVNMWIGMPISFLLISGVLTAIPNDLYEAAKVEGAGRWTQFRQITLPYVMLATAPILIMQFAGNFNNFNVIFLLTGGGPVNPDLQFAGHTDLLITWLYKLTLNNSVYNMASAVGIIVFLFVASLSIWSYRRTKSFKDEEMIQ
ncbi:ABC transporter permease subunit [Paenibacillaceae bacterium WGS1546]|uniref:sugar ABC transporter permease n=1 Tax=Cohnella sp. WGS1546 TaxID=3366810 RepID=UPI00372D4457